MDELTKEQKYTIAKFYKLYMERSNEGQTEKKPMILRFHNDSR